MTLRGPSSCKWGCPSKCYLLTESNLLAGRPFIKPFLFPSALMAPSPQKASWRRIDTDLIPSGDVRASGESSGAVIKHFACVRRLYLSPPPIHLHSFWAAEQPAGRSINPGLFSITLGAFKDVLAASQCRYVGDYCPAQPVFNEETGTGLSSTYTQSIFSPFGTPTLTVSDLRSSSFVVSKCVSTVADIHFVACRCASANIP